MSNGNGNSSGHVDPKAFMADWVRMVKAMLDNATYLMDEEASYHFATQLGCITAAVSAVMTSAPPDVRVAYEGAGAIFDAAIKTRMDYAEVGHVTEEGSTQYKVIAGGDLGRSLTLQAECHRCGRMWPMDPKHYGYPDLHSCIKT